MSFYTRSQLVCRGSSSSSFHSVIHVNFLFIRLLKILKFWEPDVWIHMARRERVVVSRNLIHRQGKIKRRKTGENSAHQQTKLLPTVCPTSSCKVAKLVRMRTEILINFNFKSFSFLHKTFFWCVTACKSKSNFIKKLNPYKDGISLQPRRQF